MAAPDLSSPSSLFSTDGKRRSSGDPASPCNTRAAAVAAYERYIRLPELSALWDSRDFPLWQGERVVKPALQALEITFRFVSVALSDPRPYANRREWRRRLESLAARQIELVAELCDPDAVGGGADGAPVAELSAYAGVLSRERSSQEVWTLPAGSSSASSLSAAAATVVCRTSEESLLPRLAAWDKSEGVAAKIMHQIESHMQGCPFSLGLGEPNLSGKPVLEYDLVVRPLQLHALRFTGGKSSLGCHRENEALFTTHQILESLVRVAEELLARAGRRVAAQEWAAAANDCWMLERVWKLLSEVEDLHLLMDPDDFLCLRAQLGFRAGETGGEPFCFRSAALSRAAAASRDLKHAVPKVLGIDVDPEGGPRVQDAAMRLYHSRRRGEAEEAGKIDLLQAFLAVEVAVRRFFFSYRLVVAAVMGSVEASGNHALLGPSEQVDPLAQMFLEPPYFPSLDAAKTFLGDYWVRRAAAPGGRSTSTK